MDGSLYLRLVLVFGSLSVMSIGGGTSLIPQMQLEAVGHHAWLTDGQFADIFSIAQAAPGPSSLIVALIGYGAGGVGAALVATLAMMLPASVLVFLSVRTWIRTSGTHWHDAVELALAPMSVGLIVATTVLMSQAVSLNGAGLALLAAATLLLSFTRLNPLYLVALGGLLGYLEVV